MPYLAYLAHQARMRRERETRRWNRPEEDGIARRSWSRWREGGR